MDLKKDIDWIKTNLDKVTEPEIVRILKQLLNYHFDKQGKRTSKADYNKAIDEAAASIESGHGTVQEDVEKKSSEW